MARTTVTLNHRTIQKYLDGGYGVKSMLRERANMVLDAAIADPHDDTGAYEASLHLDEVHTDRLVVRVVASDPKAFILEANFGILSRALDGASGLVNYTRKSDGKTIKITAAQAANYGGRS